MFTENGAELVVGKFFRSMNIESNPWLQVTKKTNGYRITLAFTPEEEARIDKNDKDEEEKPARVAHPLTTIEARQAVMAANFHMANVAIDSVRSLVDLGPYRARYSHESEARILRAIVELREAFQHAVVKPLLIQEHHDNIICWPGRGNVAAVSLA